MRKCKRNKNKDKKNTYIDDGRTISNMNVEGFRWYRTDSQQKREEALRQAKPTRAEYWAMVRAALLVGIPYLLFFLGALTAVMLLIQAWLS